MSWLLNICIKRAPKLIGSLEHDLLQFPHPVQGCHGMPSPSGSTWEVMGMRDRGRRRRREKESRQKEKDGRGEGR